MTEEQQLLLRAFAMLEYLMGILEGAQVKSDLASAAELAGDIQEHFRQRDTAQ